MRAAGLSPLVLLHLAVADGAVGTVLADRALFDDGISGLSEPARRYIDVRRLADVRDPGAAEQEERGPGLGIRAEILALVMGDRGAARAGDLAYRALVAAATETIYPGRGDHMFVLAEAEGYVGARIDTAAARGIIAGNWLVDWVVRPDGSLHVGPPAQHSHAVLGGGGGVLAAGGAMVQVEDGQIVVFGVELDAPYFFRRLTAGQSREMFAVAVAAFARAGLTVVRHPLSVDPLDQVLDDAQSAVDQAGRDGGELTTAARLLDRAKRLLREVDPEQRASALVRFEQIVAGWQRLVAGPAEAPAAVSEESPAAPENRLGDQLAASLAGLLDRTPELLGMLRDSLAHDMYERVLYMAALLDDLLGRGWYDPRGARKSGTETVFDPLRLLVIEWDTLVAELVEHPGIRRHVERVASVDLIAAPAHRAELRVLAARIAVPAEVLRRVAAAEDGVLRLDVGPTRTDVTLRVVGGGAVRGGLTAEEAARFVAVVDPVLAGRDHDPANRWVTIEWAEWVPVMERLGLGRLRDDLLALTFVDAAGRTWTVWWGHAERELLELDACGLAPGLLADLRAHEDQHGAGLDRAPR